MFPIICKILLLQKTFTIEDSLNLSNTCRILKRLFNNFYECKTKYKHPSFVKPFKNWMITYHLLKICNLPKKIVKLINFKNLNQDLVFVPMNNEFEMTIRNDFELQNEIFPNCTFEKQSQTLFFNYKRYEDRFSPEYIKWKQLIHEFRCLNLKKEDEIKDWLLSKGFFPISIEELDSLISRKLEISKFNNPELFPKRGKFNAFGYTNEREKGRHHLRRFWEIVNDLKDKKKKLNEKLCYSDIKKGSETAHYESWMEDKKHFKFHNLVIEFAKNLCKFCEKEENYEDFFDIFEIEGDGFLINL